MNNLPKFIGSTVVAGVFADFAVVFFPMKWGFIALLCVLVVDFRYTRRYRKKTGRDPLPWCTALRIFVNKAIDYMCVLLVVAVLSVLFDGAVNPQAVRWVGMAIVFVVEVAVIIHKWLRLYHPDLDFDLFGYLGEKWVVFRHFTKKNATDQTGKDREDIRGGADPERGDQA